MLARPPCCCPLSACPPACPLSCHMPFHPSPAHRDPTPNLTLLQMNSLTDKSVIGEGINPESIATGAAVALTL